MKRINLALWMAICVLSSLATPPLSRGQEESNANPNGLIIQATPWEYTSFSDFKDSSNWPTKEIYKQGTSFTSTGSKDLEERYGHPPAIVAKIKNDSDSEIEIPLKGMKSIAVRKNGKTISPIAIRNRQRSPFGSGYMNTFNTEFTGERIIVLQKSQIVDIILIFPEADIGDTLSIQDVGSVRISAPASSGEAAKFRTWTSADGQFQVIAKFIKRDGETVHLERKDDRRQIAVPLSKLSSDDRLFLRRLPPN